MYNPDRCGRCSKEIDGPGWCPSCVALRLRELAWQSAYEAARAAKPADRAQAMARVVVGWVADQAERKAAQTGG